ncbi:AlpA family phage regulatory protein [Sphingobium yanoikuyae]|jgi:prophage regulatory protein|uniref:AlpA family phage regulatory protein n=1 Tax=Sphingobium yanoikuyae TaxID=13690 RepID=A0AA42X450_SPHYA|nr:MULTISPECIES: AlpA family phage regulatory protein [Sphingobium]MEA3542930.1 AlpA family phage regulatory protein [Pseudomonadota bacterium]MDH2135064.1 AlpA family phage regulatory protein [Sphingobium yanoikuyae]MDH2153101.1 AlpA family phage regulatory protein [Sphingobium yanoikuyae]MDH2170383.1 AlpA family phage regulatory protein [Sphingobium yanoikuyae]WIA57135.1 AlpA family phage regulatory protein [Sphingobium sp. WTD-1]
MTMPPSDRILRLNTVLDRTGLSRATLYRKVQAGTFPKQIRIATRCMGWRESAINDWVRNPMFWTVEDADKRQRASSL